MEGRGGVNLMHYKLSGSGYSDAGAFSDCVCFFFCLEAKRVEGMKVTGCDGRQFMLLCLNCHLMCTQSGSLTKEDNSSGQATEMRCEDEKSLIRFFLTVKWI